MRLCDLLMESSYDGMITKMLSTYPDSSEFINEWLSFCKNTFKKSDKIVWFMKIINLYLYDRANSTNKVTELTGDISIKSDDDLQKFATDLGHFFGFNWATVEKYQFGNKTADVILRELSEIEQKESKKDKETAPVAMQTGDYLMIETGPNEGWYFIDRAYCSDEGRSGKHCGNVVGKHDVNQRILSYRKNGHVALTFILLSNGYLGEMKAKGNLKPVQKYHSAITKLLLHPKVKGINGAGYAEYMNFSIFDLTDAEIMQIENQKPNLIISQLESIPIELLRSPKFIRQTNEYVDVACNKMSGIRDLITPDGDIVTMHSAWNRAITKSSELIAYAPDNISNYMVRLKAALSRSPQLFLRLPKHLSVDFELASWFAANGHSNIRYVLPNTPRYEEICMAAVSNDGYALLYVPDEIRTEKVCMAAVSNEGLALHHVPDELKTEKVCIAAVSNEGLALHYVPDELKTEKVCIAAVSNDGDALRYVPDELKTEKVCMAAVFRFGVNMRYVPDELKSKIAAKINKIN